MGHKMIKLKRNINLLYIYEFVVWLIENRFKKFSWSIWTISVINYGTRLHMDMLNFKTI